MKSYVMISKRELVDELRRAFEAGWSGCLDMAEVVAENMADDFIGMQEQTKSAQPEFYQPPKDLYGYDSSNSLSGTFEEFELGKSKLKFFKSIINANNSGV